MSHEKAQKSQKNAEATRSPLEINQLCDQVQQTSFEIRAYLRHGDMEKVYENAISHRLRKIGLRVEQQFPIPVRDVDGTLLGDFVADLLVERVLLIELKACRAIADEHIAQLLGYLRASGIEHGLLIIFGAPVYAIKQFILS